MGLGQSNSSESEERHEEDENSTSDEKSEQPNSKDLVTKDTDVGNNQTTLPNQTRHSLKRNSGIRNAKSTPELKVDKKPKERNYSERIIREKEKLLKEKEETIRQQANLIKSQSELLGQRKHINIPNLGKADVHYDVILKPRLLKPSVTESAEFSGSLTSHENVSSNGLENRIGVTADNDYEKNYFFDRINVVKPIPPTRHEQSNQIFNLPSFANRQINDSTLGSPFQHNSHNSTSAVPYQPMHYAPHTSRFNVPPPNLNGLVSKSTASMQARLCQNNEYGRNNIKKVELWDDDPKQSTNQLLADLEKQTNYELQKLNNVHIGNSSNDNVDVKRNFGERKLRHVKSFHGIFKCSGCSVIWKSKISAIGASQKCKKCGSDVGSRMMEKNWKSDDESPNPNALVSKTERISNVD